MSPDDQNRENQNPINAIDRVIHEPARLMILACLYVVESADFVYLVRLTGLTPGNLSSHLSKLEEAGYVAIEKEFKAKKPLTMVRLSSAGRDAFRAYRQSMQQILAELPD